MDAAACRRAAIESLSENLTDGFTSAVFWYALGGLPGLVLFKVVSTMDSMVGYKTPRYLRFGWCGARLDDVMNYVPARLTWLLLALVALVMPRLLARQGARASASRSTPSCPDRTPAGAKPPPPAASQRRLVGPIWLRGMLVTDVWIGDPRDPPLETRRDLMRAMWLVTVTGLVSAAIAASALFLRHG